MKFSYQWLSELVPGLDIEPARLQQLITLKTAECEGIEPSGSDWIIDIDNKSLTHRPDLWGHIGMAREVAAITGRALHDPVKLDLLPHADPAIRVSIADHLLCPRYSALVLGNVRVGDSPAWLRDRLEHIGLNSINNIVDVTNYILAELPQPMHAFDADKLAGDTIYVRSAEPGAKFNALNGETYTLTADDLVIADASGPIALAGVIGGADTAISDTTTRVVLESANFHAARVRFTSVRHKLRTDASVRFEKSLDPENTVRGLARAVELIQQVSPGMRIVGGVADDHVTITRPDPVVLPVATVVKKLGTEVAESRITEILAALGFGVSQTSPGVLTVAIPTWRATKDISLQDDLVEEIGRMIGYDSITPIAPRVAAVVPPANPQRVFFRQVRTQLAAQGFTEIYNYSFVNQAEVERFSFDLSTHIGVENPIASESTHLRRSLLPGLFQNIVSNVRNFRSFRIFEIGNEIHPRPDDLPNEIPHCAAAIYEAHADERDFFEHKRVIECLFPCARLTAAEAHPYEHPFRAAEIRWRNSVIGRLFELHPSLLEQENIEGRAVIFDVDLSIAQQLAARSAPTYTPPRRYPTSGFDLSVVAQSRTPVEEVQDALSNFAGADLASIDFLRQFEGSPLRPGEKSVSYHLEVGAPDHTLSADEVTAIRTRIIDGMRSLGFDLRV